MQPTASLTVLPESLLVVHTSGVALRVATLTLLHAATCGTSVAARRSTAATTRRAIGRHVHLLARATVVRKKEREFLRHTEGNNTAMVMVYRAMT